MHSFLKEENLYCTRICIFFLMQLNYVMIDFLNGLIVPSQFANYVLFSMLTFISYYFRFEPGSDKSHFCKPTSVAVARTGQIFIADG
jgi:hypothetical protein